MAIGVIVLVAVLAAATAFGMTWKNRNGRLRPAAAGAQAAAGRSAAPGGEVISEAGLGEPPGGLATLVQAAAPHGEVLSEAELGEPLGALATLVQFSTAFCAPCRATRVVLADVASLVEGVAHVEIDAESHLGLVRRLDVRRTPTVLVLGPDGRIAQRGSGQPRKADVLAAIGKVQR
ncbi:MAG TPA: thioredoxin family protein [Streptosporangiaceae bacterium]|jgi:thiol-disulfide isomerase/thioredoxin